MNSRASLNWDRNAWSVNDSMDLYGVRNWGDDYFTINERGNMEVHPDGFERPGVDLMDLVEQMQRRGVQLPLLLRFNGILRRRITQLNEAFGNAIREYGYQGSFTGVYPIKVNQQRHVVEEIVRHGRQWNFGIEAGSKPELMAVLAVLDNPEALIICNGYKDEEFLEMALLSTKMGRTVIPVVEKFSELATILALARQHNVRPMIGLRAKLAAKGAGKWLESGGDRSKFGLSVSEILKAVEMLREVDMLDCLQLVHFHLGSQITNIRSIKTAITECGRVYCELARLGAKLRYIDVGGGLGVDYDGSKTNFNSSTNYSLQEYANSVVSIIQECCNEAKIPHPIIVTESGRAITAHHSVLVFNVLGMTEFGSTTVPDSLPADAPQVLKDMMEIYKTVSRKNVQEAYHDATDYKDDAISRFSLGLLSLATRAQVEDMYWAICMKCLKIVRELQYVPEELEGLEKALSDTYFCNFSAFQSVPDFWAIEQLFPIVPVHRHKEMPTRRAVLADLTCDSDGKIDHFIDLRDVKDVLELHPLNGSDYFIAIFMVGAYQEILGDLHNLFGDTNAVHVEVEADGTYRIDHVVKGDTVAEVLQYVQFTGEHMIHQIRRVVEAAVKRGAFTLEESAYFLRRYEEGLSGYTYME